MVSNPQRLNDLLGLMAQTPKRQFKGLLYSNYGAGKTTLALKILDQIVPDDKVILMIDTSDNKDVVPQAGINHRVIPLTFTTIEDLRLITEAMIEGVDGWASVGGILIDEASTSAEEDIDRVYESRKNAIQSGQMKMPKDGIPITPDWSDYRPALIRYRTMLADLYDLPNMHVIMCAHEHQQMDGTNLIEIRPNIPNKTMQAIARPLHMIGRVSANVSKDMGTGHAVYERKVQIHPLAKVVAKSRLGVPDVTFDANYLPALIKQWLDAGANEVEQEPIPEPVNAGAAGTETNSLDTDNPFA